MSRPKIIQQPSTVHVLRIPYYYGSINGLSSSSSSCTSSPLSSSMQSLQMPQDMRSKVYVAGNAQCLRISPTTSTQQYLSFSSTSSNDENDAFFASTTFESMGIQSPVLLQRIYTNLGLERPTQIQEKAFQAIQKGIGGDDNDDDATTPSLLFDVTIGAETGSGKTYAYLLPLLDSILQEKARIANQQTSQGEDDAVLLPTYDYARVVILVPNKELVHQIVRMAVPLCGGTIRQSLVWGASGTDLLDQLAPMATTPHEKEHDPSKLVRLAIMQGGLKEPLDFKPFRDSLGLGGNDAPVDIVVTTPAALGPLALKPKYVDLFADIRTLVVDEADMLLDGGYLRDLENVLMGFRRADRLWKNNRDDDNDNNNSNNMRELATPTKTQHIFCAATLPDMGLKSVDAYLQRKFPNSTRIQLDNMHNAKHSGLAEATQWYLLETKKERIDRLVELLEVPKQEQGLQGEKIMLFLNSVEDVEGVHQALVQRGISAVPYHAKLSLEERTQNLEQFRVYNSNESKDNKDDAVPILVCTDLASRGLDIPGVTAVVQLQFSGNVVSHLHRMGRCGRAGQRSGRGLVFYSKQEAELISVVQQAEEQQARMVLQQDVLSEDDNNKYELKDSGKVKNAFSRKRGFTKKRKKLLRESEI